MAWAYPAALGVALAGCTGGTQGGANAPEVDLGHGESQEGVRVLASEGAEGRASGEGGRAKVAPLPAEFSSLGKPCPSGPEAMEPGKPQPICGRDNRIAALWKMSMMGHVQALPEPVIRRTPTPSTPTMGGYGDARVHLDGEHLWIASACMMCRVPSESLWIGDLSLVSDEQIGMVQAQMGLPQKPALRDEKSWRTALAKNTPGE